MKYTLPNLTFSSIDTGMPLASFFFNFNSTSYSKISCWFTIKFGLATVSNNIDLLLMAQKFLSQIVTLHPQSQVRVDRTTQVLKLMLELEKLTQTTVLRSLR